MTEPAAPAACRKRPAQGYGARSYASADSGLKIEAPTLLLETLRSAPAPFMV